jgi:hypothetical protein
VHTTHTTKDCCRHKKDRMMKANFHTAKKAGQKPNPAKQSFAQLSKNLDKLENILRKLLLSLINAIRTMAILIANKKLGQVALGN